MIPEEYEWPVWPNDGEPVRIGDWYTMCGETKRVGCVSFQGNREYTYVKVDTEGAGFFEKECEHMPDPPMVSQARLALEDYMCALDDRPAELTRVLEMLQDMEERI